MAEEHDERHMWQFQNEHALLRAIIENAPEGIVVTDEKAHIVLTNPTADRLYSRPVPYGQSYETHAELQITHLDGTPCDPRDLPLTRSALDGEVHTNVELAILWPDGQKRDLLVNTSPIKDDKGNILGAVGVFQDISGRTKAEERFKEAVRDMNESRKQVLDTLESITDGFFALDNLWRFTYINGRAQQLLGLRKEDVLFRGIWDKLPNAQVLRLYKELHLAAEHEAATSFEEFISAFDKWFEFHVYPYKNGMSVYFSDITERKRAEEALRESEQRVRRKLESILSPEGDVGNLELEDIIDAPALQALVDDLYRLANLPIGIIDLKGKVLVGVGWQDVCTKFHRTHPDTCRYCVESDLELTRGIPAGEFKLYKCKNNMWDAATPLIVGGQHMGNLFWGQFFFDDEPVDREFFRAQARKYGFNEEEYLAVLEAAPRISREFLDTGMSFYLKLANMISKLSYSNIKLARSLTERDALMDLLRRSEERLNESKN